MRWYVFYVEKLRREKLSPRDSRHFAKEQLHLTSVVTVPCTATTATLLMPVRIESAFHRTKLPVWVHNGATGQRIRRARGSVMRPADRLCSARVATAISAFVVPQQNVDVANNVAWTTQCERRRVDAVAWTRAAAGQTSPSSHTRCCEQQG